MAKTIFQLEQEFLEKLNEHFEFEYRIYESSWNGNKKTMGKHITLTHDCRYVFSDVYVHELLNLVEAYFAPVKKTIYKNVIINGKWREITFVFEKE